MRTLFTQEIAELAEMNRLRAFRGLQASAKLGIPEPVEGCVDRWMSP